MTTDAGPSEFGVIFPVASGGNSTPILCTTCRKPINDEWWYASRSGEVSHLVCAPKDDVRPADTTSHD